MSSPGRTLVGRGPVLAAVLLLAANLRPMVPAAGSVLGRIRADLHLDGTMAGLFTSLPLLAFGGFGMIAPWLANQLGTHRAIAIALAATTAGQLLRTLVPNAVMFLVWTVVGLGGIAVGNVLLPSLVRRHFPERIGLVTALYGACLALGLTLGAILTVPLSDLLGGWRPAFWVWVVPALMAAIWWLVLARRDSEHVSRHRRSSIGVLDVARTRLGWYLAIFFAFQSGMAYAVFGWLASIYVAAGFSPAQAGLYLGIATGVGLPLGLVLPAYTARRQGPYGLILVIGATAVVAFTALLVMPRAAPALWAVLVAVGTAAFPVFLALVGLRARSPEGTAALSGFTQSVGFLLAIPIPLLVGVLHERTGSFTQPLLLLAAIAVPITGFALLAARPAYVEDQVR